MSRLDPHASRGSCCHQRDQRHLCAEQTGRFAGKDRTQPQRRGAGGAAGTAGAGSRRGHRHCTHPAFRAYRASATPRVVPKQRHAARQTARGTARPAHGPRPRCSAEMRTPCRPGTRRAAGLLGTGFLRRLRPCLAGRQRAACRLRKDVARKSSFLPSRRTFPFTAGTPRYGARTVDMDCSGRGDCAGNRSVRRARCGKPAGERHGSRLADLPAPPVPVCVPRCLHPSHQYPWWPSPAPLVRGRARRAMARHHAASSHAVHADLTTWEQYGSPSAGDWAVRQDRIWLDQNMCVFPAGGSLTGRARILTTRPAPRPQQRAPDVLRRALRRHRDHGHRHLRRQCQLG